MRICIKTIILFFCLNLFQQNIISQNVELKVQKGHYSSVEQLHFSPNNKYLASTDERNNIKIWFIATGSEMISTKFTDTISCMKFNENSEKLLLGFTNGFLKEINIETSRVKDLYKLNFQIYDIDPTFQSDEIIVASDKVYLINPKLSTQKIISDKEIIKIHKNSKKKQIYLCDNSGYFIKADNNYNLQNSAIRGVRELDINADKRYKKKAKQYIAQINNLEKKYEDIDHIEKEKKKEKKKNNVDGKIIKVKNKLEDAKKIVRLNSLSTASFLNSKPHIVTAKYSRIQIYNYEKQQREYLYKSKEAFSPFTSVAISEKNKIILASNQDSKVYVFNFQKGKYKFRKILKEHLLSVNSVSFNGDESIFATASSDRTIIIWNSKTLKPIKKLYSRAYPINCLSVSKNGESVVFGDESGFIKSLNLNSTNYEISALKASKKGINDLSYFANDSLILAGENGDKVLLINFDGKRKRKSYRFKPLTIMTWFFYDFLEFMNLHTKNSAVIKKIELTTNNKYLYIKGVENNNNSIIELAFDTKKHKINDYLGFNIDNSAINELKELKSKLQNDKSGNGHNDSITDINLLPDKKHVITSSKDGTLKLWNRNNKQLIFTIIPLDEDKRIIITSDNYYLAPDKLEGFGFKIGKEFYPPEQFDIKYNRPDKVLELTPWADKSLVPLYYQAYQKRLRKMNFTEDMLSKEWHIPEIKILRKEEYELKTTKQNLSFEFVASDTKYKLDRINVWVNEIPLYGINGINLRELDTLSITKKVNLLLSKGENKIQVSSLNQTGAESYKETIYINYTPKETSKPNLHIVTIGVSEYKEQDRNLKYAAKDGKDIINFFSSNKNKIWGNISVDSLFNENVTVEKIKSLKQKLLKTTVDDQVILFVSGHGLLDDSLDFYFASHNMDFDNPAKYGIAYDLLENLLDSIPARKKLMLIDACHSGETDKDDLATKTKKEVLLADGAKATVSVPNEKKDPNKKGGKNKISKKRKKTGLQNSFELMQQLFADLSRSSGSVVLSAAAGEGYALESAEWNNGAFTYSLLSGLKSGFADADKSGEITVTELKEYVLKKVVEITNGRQKPTVRNDNLEFDFRVW